MLQIHIGYVRYAPSDHLGDRLWSNDALGSRHARSLWLPGMHIV